MVGLHECKVGSADQGVENFKNQTPGWSVLAAPAVSISPDKAAIQLPCGNFDGCKHLRHLPELQHSYL